MKTKDWLFPVIFILILVALFIWGYGLTKAQLEFGRECDEYKLMNNFDICEDKYNSISKFKLNGVCTCYNHSSRTTFYSEDANQVEGEQ